MTQCHALIPCGGKGERIGGEIPKQYMDLLGKPMVNYSLDVFLKANEISSVWVGISQNLSEQAKAAINWPTTAQLKIVETAGDSRHQTVLNTLNEMLLRGIPESDWVLVHDAARPGISLDLISRLIDSVFERKDVVPGGILALPVSDSLKRQGANVGTPSAAISSGGVNRDGLWQAQTPQMFKLGELKYALEKALIDKAIVTDEASSFERLNQFPLLIQGSSQNLKVTYPEDWILIKSILGQQENAEFEFMQRNLNKPIMRVGQGYDVHQLVEGRLLILGGVKIPNEKGLLGHSDADALLHALTDALLGSVGLGDIGRHFPDTDPKFKGVDSRSLLVNAYEKVKVEGYLIGNIDATIICQKPKLASYIPQMIELIANDLGLETNQINIKAKTNEQLGYLGRSEAISAEAVVMVYSGRQ